MNDSAAGTFGRPRAEISPWLWLIPIAAAGWSVVVFGGAGWPRIAALALAGLAVFLIPLYRWPLVVAAMMPVFIISPQVAKLFAYEVFVAIVAAVLIVVGARQRSPWLGRLSGLEVLVFALFAWGVFSYFWVWSAWWWLFGVRKYLIGFIALWVAWRMARFVDREILLAGVPAGACALSLAVVAQASRTGFFQAVNIEHMRTTATQLGWGQANFLAALIALMLPTGIYLAMHAKRPAIRILGWVSVPMSALLITLAASRGGAILLIAIALFAIFRSRIKPWIAVTSSVAMIALLLLGPGGSLLMSRFTNIDDMLSAVIRLMYFREAWGRVVDHWPLGMGMGQGMMFPDRLYKEDPHNYWLVLASEFGIVGLLIWIAILVAIWRRISRLTRNPDTLFEGQALQLTFVIAQLNLMFEPTFQGLQYHALFYWIFGAYFGSAERRARERSTALVPAPAPVSHGLPLSSTGRLARDP